MGCLFKTLVWYIVPLPVIKGGEKGVEHLKRISMVLGIATMIAAILVTTAVPTLAHSVNVLVFVPAESVPPGLSTPAEGTTYSCSGPPYSWAPEAGEGNNTCTPLQLGSPTGSVCTHRITFFLSGYRVPAFMCHPEDGSGQTSGQPHEGH